MPSKAERTKQFIIEKTAPVFNTKGYAGTSLNDMITATGLTKGSIYGNFENKDEVALAAFDHNFMLVVKHIRTKMDARTSIVDKLLVYPKTYRNYLKFSFLRSGCPIANTSTEADDTHPLLKAKAVEALQFWRGAVERQLKAGIKNKELKAKIDVNEVVSVLVSLIQGGAMHAKLTGKMSSLNASMDFLERLIKELKR
ncbi:MAG: TetR/AcrR family transcriptional regulator [Bacteroidota bacterium]|nr:TetR/AcrR family transcriptional regulator [Bacteroidota bacterium]